MLSLGLFCSAKGKKKASPKIGFYTTEISRNKILSRVKHLSCFALLSQATEWYHFYTVKLGRKKWLLLPVHKYVCSLLLFSQRGVIEREPCFVCSFQQVSLYCRKHPASMTSFWQGQCVFWLLITQDFSFLWQAQCGYMLLMSPPN